MDSKPTAKDLQPKRPRVFGWARLPDMVDADGTAEAYQNDRICALSSVAEMELPQQGGKLGPTWHLSVSSFRPGGNVRPSGTEVRKALKAFLMEEAEEDNHSPGRARHFFLPVDPEARRACECKEDEEQVTEPDGYRWSRPRR